MGTKKKKKAPTRSPVQKGDGKTVWMSCRASEKCSGKTAKNTLTFRLSSGGVSRRYRCMTCGGTFHVLL